MKLVSDQNKGLCEQLVLLPRRNFKGHSSKLDLFAKALVLNCSGHTDGRVCCTDAVTVEVFTHDSK